VSVDVLKAHESECRRCRTNATDAEVGAPNSAPCAVVWIRCEEVADPWRPPNQRSHMSHAAAQTPSPPSHCPQRAHVTCAATVANARQPPNLLRGPPHRRKESTASSAAAAATTPDPGQETPDPAMEGPILPRWPLEAPEMEGGGRKVEEQRRNQRFWLGGPNKNDHIFLVC
jgi:hypothetical protein